MEGVFLVVDMSRNPGCVATQASTNHANQSLPRKVSSLRIRFQTRKANREQCEVRDQLPAAEQLRQLYQETKNPFGSCSQHSSTHQQIWLQTEILAFPEANGKHPTGFNGRRTSCQISCFPFLRCSHESKLSFQGCVCS